MSCASRVHWLAFVMVALIGCRESTGIYSLPAIVDLEELDPPVRQQLLEARSRVSRLLAAGEPQSEGLGRAFGDLGRIYHAYGDLEPARQCYLQARVLDTEQFRWIYLLGRVERSLGRISDSDSTLDAALLQFPEDVPTLVWRAENAIDQNRLEAAENGFQRAIEVDRSCTQARYGLARVAIERGEFSNALSHLETAYAEQPQATPLLYSLAAVHRALGNLERASVFSDLIPRNTLLQRGVVLEDPLMREVRALEKGATVHEHRGLRAVARGHFIVAASELQQAVTLDPGRLEARHNLALAFLHLGRIQKARDEIDHILQVHPDFAPSHLLLARLLRKEGRIDEAEKHLRRAVAADRDSAQVHRSLGEFLAAEGRQDEAARALDQAFLLDPTYGPGERR